MWIIQGDGIGATAAVEFDSDTGTLTGVKVLTPGCGYTWAKAYIYVTGNSNWQPTLLGNTTTPIDCNLGDNVNTGSFTKAGAGDFTLNAANTWGGDTRLEGGVLRLGAAGALPAGSKVVYAGGTLESTAAASPAAFTAELSPALIAARKSVKLITYTDAAPATLPAITLLGVPAEEEGRWMVDASGTTVYARCIKGMRLYFK